MLKWRIVTTRQMHERQKRVASSVLKAIKRGFGGFTQIYADFYHGKRANGKSV
ncbi:MAG: hypothetical protein FWG87_09685 [Defluviitaleaceae bacterium]|nr:hypothetical protein [Defluviitaleaceae bacterium]